MPRRVVGDLATLSNDLKVLSGKVENLSAGMLNGIVYKGHLVLYHDQYARPKQLFNDDPACCLLDGLQKPLRNGWMWRIHLDSQNVSGDYVVVDDPNTGNSLKLGEGDYVIIRNHLPEVYEVVPDDTMGLNDFDVINAQDEDDTKLAVLKQVSAYLDSRIDESLVSAKSYADEISTGLSILFDGKLSSVSAYALDESIKYTNGVSSEICSTVDTRLSTLSNDLLDEVDAKYVHKAGDTIAKLSVARDLDVSGKTTINHDFGEAGGTKLELSKDKVELKSFAPLSISSTNDSTIAGHNIALNAHNLSINLEDGVDDLFIGDRTIKEVLSDTYLISDDISYRYDKSENALKLGVRGYELSVDAAELFDKKIIKDVRVVKRESGTYIAITFDVDGNPSTSEDEKTIEIRIDDFFKLYTSGYGISIDNELNISIAKSFDDQIQAIQGYVNELSGPVGPYIGIIPSLSAAIDKIDLAQTQELFFGGLIELDTSDTSKHYPTIGAFLSTEIGGADAPSQVRNNSYFDIKFFHGLQTSSVIITEDGLSVGDGDQLIIHEHNPIEGEEVKFISWADLKLIDENAAGNVYLIKAGVSRYEFEAEAKKRKDDDDYISAWIKQNFANTGEENDSLTTVVRQELSANHDLSVASNAYVLSDLSVAGSLFINGAQLEITVEPPENPEEDPTTIAKTVADEITLSSASSDTQITITNNHIAFSKAIVNVDATSSFTVSADEVKVIDATSSQVQILSVLSVETGQAIATRLSSDCLSARILSINEAFINSLAVSVETALSIQVPFDKLVDPGTGNSAKDEHDQLQAEVDEISTYYLDRRTGEKVSGDVEIISSLAVGQNILQGNSLTSGTGISGTLDQTRIDNVQMSGNCCVALNNSSSFGTQSFAANQSKAYSKNSTAFGNSTAYGSYSFAQGAASNAYGYASHVEGRETQTGLPDYIGCSSKLTAYGCDAHAEGDHTKAIGNFSHAEGSFTEAYDLYSHAEGNYTKVLFGNSGHAEGQQTEVSANYAHAEGTYSKAYGEGAHAEGDNTYAEGSKSHTEGSRTSAIGSCSHAEGLLTIAYGINSHAEGDQTYAEGPKSHAEGGETSALGFASHSEGRNTIARAIYSHSEGANSEVLSTDDYSFVWSGKYNPHSVYYKSHGVGSFSINPQDGTRGFWIGDQPFEYYLSTLEDKMISNDSVLSIAIDRKIFVDGLSVESLCAIHISQNDFYQKVALSLDTIKDNELYIVSGNYINAYGQQMKNLSAPTDLSDAATKEYVDQISSTLSDQIQNLSTDLSTEISALTRNLYDQLQHIAEDEIISSLNQKSCISNVICAVVGIKDTLISLRETLSGMLGL